MKNLTWYQTYRLALAIQTLEVSENIQKEAGVKETLSGIGLALALFFGGMSEAEAAQKTGVNKQQLEMAIKQKKQVKQPKQQPKQKQESKSSKIERLIPALIRHESNGNAKAIGDQGRAWGILQIHSEMAVECSRLSGKKFTHKDAFNPQKAKEMCRIFLNHYSDENTSIEDMARMWNGGPRGDHKWKTVNYWNMVKQYI